MIFHRIGGAVSDLIDNILISRRNFFGVLFWGLYSNYLLVIDAVKNALTQCSPLFRQALVILAPWRARRVPINFINAFHSIIFVLLPPFIGLFFGEEYIINQRGFAFVVLKFYIECMRRTILTFKESFGLP